MKATIDIPDELYRNVKACTALEGRPLRAVAIELFENYVQNQRPRKGYDSDASGVTDTEHYPWLKISAKYVQPGINSDMRAIRNSIARGWAAESGVENAIARN